MGVVSDSNDDWTMGNGAAMIIVNLDGDLALAAAVVGAEHKLPLADSIVYATARQLDAVVWTQDDDFEGLPNARYFRKRRA